ncbi:transmembrane protein, putative (macronuclear) [Tetrahymena thermophila SB210]|uniref:Transmembrane protein, putative n=1 Tax=Tetrahymena thermophila (strain SB210) TaxID=312017 RepID=W7XGI4_TETTS|nr:transmembrane protein, putative [Tetrahymena thermophila SB210]EWS72014.1 transmembrane protein, putative [Tetrahymena thermophila SB210]|eukprot:XP_012655444.1 transmembrane protein, putative [Tetrahymena thermophila SB210]
MKVRSFQNLSSLFKNSLLKAITGSMPILISCDIYKSIFQQILRQDTDSEIKDTMKANGRKRRIFKSQKENKQINKQINKQQINKQDKQIHEQINKQQIKQYKQKQIKQIKQINKQTQTRAKKKQIQQIDRYISQNRHIHKILLIIICYLFSQILFILKIFNYF